MNAEAIKKAIRQVCRCDDVMRLWLFVAIVSFFLAVVVATCSCFIRGPVVNYHLGEYGMITVVALVVIAALAGYAADAFYQSRTKSYDDSVLPEVIGIQVRRLPVYNWRHFVVIAGEDREFGATFEWYPPRGYWRVLAGQGITMENIDGI